ncbi:ER-resident thioredoxin [Stachybotrys elegans]|uniref:Protein disulfide-isomerase n=1 Tax=Stachybotrys elegans TaxID=80388 RepID=A0A8K0STD2_9HYPO|nr:ER-resident thioredoxin [Stachybotrys elegans]
MWVRTGVVGFLGAALLAAQVASASSSDWQFIDGDAFTQRLAKQEPMLVAFVAPEDDLSKPLLPEWKKLRKELPYTAALNCTSIPAVCREAQVSSLPVIRLYQADGSMVRYRGPRRAAAIAPFIKRMVRPIVTELAAHEQSTFAKVDDIVIVAQLWEEDEALTEHFLHVAEEYRDRYTFGITSPQSSASGTVVCRNNPDDMEHTMSDLDRVGALEELLEKCTTPLVMPLTRRNELVFNTIAKSPVYYFSDDEADRQAYTNMVRPVAKAFSEYLLFATVDIDEYPLMAPTLGMQGRGLCLQNLHNGQIFHFPAGSALSAQAVQNFIVAVSEGKVQPWTGAAEGGRSHDEL